LEQKKKLFPRFYFLSNVVLVNILSNGTNPVIVSKQLKDCFDGMKTVRFVKDAHGKETNQADGMYSKETEFIPFKNNFVFEGAVEAYLSGLETHMRTTLRDILEHAKEKADNWELEKCREEWLKD